MQNLGFTLIFLLPATWFINKSRQHPDLVDNFTQLQPSLAKVQTFPYCLPYNFMILFMIIIVRRNSVLTIRESLRDKTVQTRSNTSPGGSEEVGYLVTKTGVIRMFHDSHKLYAVVS